MLPACHLTANYLITRVQKDLKARVCDTTQHEALEPRMPRGPASPSHGDLLAFPSRGQKPSLDFASLWTSPPSLVPRLHRACDFPISSRDLHSLLRTPASVSLAPRLCGQDSAADGSVHEASWGRGRSGPHRPSLTCRQHPLTTSLQNEGGSILFVKS